MMLETIDDIEFGDNILYVIRYLEFKYLLFFYNFNTLKSSASELYDVFVTCNKK